MPLCSLSTGMISVRCSAAFALTSSPAMTSDSLLARATRLDTAMADSVAGSPAAPAIATTTTSGETSSSILSTHRSPVKSFTPGAIGSGSPIHSASASGRSAFATRRSPCQLALALRATTRNRSRIPLRTSIVCRPTDPVAPNIATVCVTSSTFIPPRTL